MPVCTMRSFKCEVMGKVNLNLSLSLDHFQRLQAPTADRYTFYP